MTKTYGTRPYVRGEEERERRADWTTPEGAPSEPGWGPRWALWDFEGRKWDALPPGYNPHHEPCDCPEHRPDEHETVTPLPSRYPETP